MKKRFLPLVLTLALLLTVIPGLALAAEDDLAGAAYSGDRMDCRLPPAMAEGYAAYLDGCGGCQAKLVDVAGDGYPVLALCGEGHNDLVFFRDGKVSRISEEFSDYMGGGVTLSLGTLNGKPGLRWAKDDMLIGRTVWLLYFTVDGGTVKREKQAELRDKYVWDEEGFGDHIWSYVTDDEQVLEDNGDQVDRWAGWEGEEPLLHWMEEDYFPIKTGFTGGSTSASEMAEALRRYAAARSGIAYPATQTVRVDGEAVEFQMYALKDKDGNLTNYVKIRDIASILSGTKAQFEVGYYGMVNLVKGWPYTPNGSEGKTPFSGNRVYTKATDRTNVNGSLLKLDAILLTDDRGGGYTYYQLRDLGKTLGFNVGWSRDKGVFVETDKPYDPAD